MKQQQPVWLKSSCSAPAHSTDTGESLLISVSMALDSGELVSSLIFQALSLLEAGFAEESSNPA